MSLLKNHFDWVFYCQRHSYQFLKKDTFPNHILSGLMMGRTSDKAHVFRMKHETFNFGEEIA